jgi:hypothetical protein
MTATETYIIKRPLTGELADPSSPVRQFLDSHFSHGRSEVQRRYREAAPPLALPAVGPEEANPGTLGTAADWLLRFLVFPRPALDLAAHGAVWCGARPSSPNLNMADALADLADTLGMSRADLQRGRWAFNGPAEPSDVEPEHLARACWALALLTEAYRGGPAVATAGPLGRFRDSRPGATELLALAPPAAVEQLIGFRHIFETVLLPALAGHRGMWAIGPTFTGSQNMNADADLIAAGLLLDLKTTAKKPSLLVTDLFQVIGYVLLDYDDEFGLSSVGIFSARYAYLATWELGALLDDLTRHETSLAAIRAQFRDLLTKHAAPRR